MYVSGTGNLPFEERLNKLGLTTFKPRRERGDIIDTYKILTGKVDVLPGIWFAPLTSREGASSIRTTSGHLNLARKDIRLNQYQGCKNAVIFMTPKYDLSNLLKISVRRIFRNLT